MQIILASNSPRRKELLSRICPSFITLPSDADESVPVGTSPRDTVKILARRKAEYVFKTVYSSGAVPFGRAFAVLGSDTVVAYKDRVLGKPANEEEAFDILKMLSGKTHRVYTGVCFVSPFGTQVETEVSEVVFYDLTEEKIRAYIATGSPMDKAGAYGIQDGGLVKSFTGSYTNIVGLPLELTERMYKEVIKNAENSD